MTELNKQLLFAAGPSIFRKDSHIVKTATIDCSDGWLSILLDLVIKLEARNSKLPYHQRLGVMQIKEKFGTLRFYVDQLEGLDEQDIQDAEEKSTITCEDCGARGFLFDDGWMRTLCDPCVALWKIHRGRHEISH